jgi:hypothetical protein
MPEVERNCRNTRTHADHLRRMPKSADMQFILIRVYTRYGYGDLVTAFMLVTYYTDIAINYWKIQNTKLNMCDFVIPKTDIIIIIIYPWNTGEFSFKYNAAFLKCENDLWVFHK